MKQNNVFLFVFLLLLISLNIFADSLLEQGIKEYNRNNYNAAIDYLTGVLVADEDNFSCPLLSWFILFKD